MIGQRKSVPDDTRAANRLFLVLVLCFLLASSVIAYIFIFGAAAANKMLGTSINGLSVIKTIFSNNVFSTLFSQGMILLCCIIYIIVKKKNVKEVLRLNKINIGSIFLLIMLGYAIMPLTTFLNLISMLFVENNIANTVADMTNTMSMGVMLLLVAITPAIVEETAFRGIILSGQRKANVRKAIVINGILFGVFHLNFNQFAYAVVLGMIFALVVESTNSIFSTMIIHFVINSSSVFVTYASKYLGNSVDSQETQQLTDSLMSNSKTTIILICGYGIAALFGIVIAGFLLYAIVCIEGRKKEFLSIFSNKYNNRKKLEQTDTETECELTVEKERDGILTYSLAVAIILCIAYMIELAIS